MREVTVSNGKEIKSVDTKGVLHNVFIIDASGSMNQAQIVDGKRLSKYDVAVAGVNTEIAELTKDDKGDTTISVFEFDSNAPNTERITEHCYNTQISKIEKVNFRGASGNTPLYQTIGYVLEKLLRTSKKNDTVLVKIFTDGAHNCNWGKYDEKECKALIKDAEDNREFIITFVGTEQDTAHAIENLGISIGNTITYDGTAADFGNTYFMAMTSTSNLREEMRSGKALKRKAIFEDVKLDKEKKENTSNQ